MTAPSAPVTPPVSRKLGGNFLAGAGGRLLPASVPFRFFGAAIVFHLLAWLAFFVGADHWPQWRGGLGWPLAALHLITLGTLLASAIGASLQLLPVATLQPVRAPRLAGALWWLYVPGVGVLTLGMGLARPGWIAVGAAAVGAALVVWAALLALNLLGARGMPGVVLHGWGAMAALALLLLSAAALVALWLGEAAPDRDVARALHLLTGVFGVMGLLALGFSYVLLPMFALAASPPEQDQLAAGTASIAAIVAAAAAALTAAPALQGLAIVGGALAFALHLRLMQRTLAGGMRRDFGRALALMRGGWIALAVAWVLAAAAALADPGSPAAGTLGRLFGIAVVVGWLLSFLFGVLERILPFLASMHAARGQRRPPTPSALTFERPLALHFACHFTAVALLAVATIAGSAVLTALASGIGAAGGTAFAVFFGALLLRMRRAAAQASGKSLT